MSKVIVDKIHASRIKVTNYISAFKNQGFTSASHAVRVARKQVSSPFAANYEISNSTLATWGLDNVIR